jgi:ubiquinol-cytochrome c reductase cytochrome b subunit
MTEAYSSTLAISFDVRGGLLMRQIHHWAALFFTAAVSVHLLRVFFTGAFRKPREINWVIGTLLLVLALLEGFSGYSLPDDLLSGTGLRIAHGIILALPVIGTYVAMFLFGGEFPGTDFMPRLYAIHILLIPGILLALITVHLIMVFYQKHTQFPGPGRTESNVVGFRLFPIYMAKAGGFFFVVFGITVLIAALVTINPIWMYGPYTPSQVTAGSQPDWYIGWLDGAVRLMPNWESVIFGYNFSWNILNYVHSVGSVPMD